MQLTRPPWHLEARFLLLMKFSILFPSQTFVTAMKDQMSRMQSKWDDTELDPFNRLICTKVLVECTKILTDGVVKQVTAAVDDIIEQ